MKLKNLHEVDTNPFEYPEEEISQAEMERQEAEARARREEKKKKALIISDDGKTYRIQRSLTNGEAVDKITTLEGLFPTDREDLVITIAGVHGIENLKGLPAKCEQLIITTCKGLTSLKGIPSYVKHYFTISGCTNLTIDVLPEETGEIRIDGTKLDSVNVLPKKIEGELVMRSTGIKSISGIHKHVEFVAGASGFTHFTLMTEANGDPVKNLLGIVLIKGLNTVTLGWSTEMDECQEFINDFLEKHRGSKPSAADILELQDAMIDAGLEEYANL